MCSGRDEEGLVYGLLIVTEKANSRWRRTLLLGHEHTPLYS